ncbi:MAG: 8-amino-7-oxononanoate synthase [Planctomycetes bacterium]|nr:8-amino-7-oxononanoate synthase [Planctomycetota bacterium]
MPESPFHDQLDDAARQNRLRKIRVFEGPQGPVMRLDGREVLNFSSNDYLGYANHPEVREAAKKAIDEYGWGAGASRLVCGTQGPHAVLEREIATWLDAEDAVLFPSGAAANAGLIGAVVGRGDCVLSDEHNHASIVDGCRASGASVLVFPHADAESLEKLLVTAQGRRLVITDTVFSMDGDIAPVAALAAAAKGALFAVDEAHATGVIGPGGRGVCAEAGVKPSFRMVTLSKSFGGFGALVAGSREACDMLRNFARSLMFTTGIPAAAAAAALAALRLIQNRPEDRERLAATARRLRTGLAQVGYDVAGDPRIPIAPVLIGENYAALATSEFLLSRGIFVHPIRPPAVPAGTARLRITVTASHTPAQVDRLLDALTDWKRRR